MSLQTEKLKLIQLLLNTDNPSIIEKIKSIFNSSEKNQDIWEELSAAQQIEIESAIEESIKGLTVDYDTFMGQHRS